MAQDPEDDRLDELLADALERLEAGGPAALDELLAAHPDEAPRLRERLSALQAAGLARESGDELPERLGDFRLLQRLGGGGMGVVYLAEQESLGRRVALKLVRPELLYFPGARERFRREVTAVARLSDPGIVPVYSVGEERPDGEALAAAIRAGRPVAPRTLNPAVPRDAETVCLTAMDRDRARRYASAQALADDLRNVLELRPVSARRPGPWLRARRFVQRHPAGSTALALGALLLVGGPLGWALQQRRAAVDVQAALDRANVNLGRALAAVEALLLRVGDQRLRNVPQADAVRRELLHEAQGFYAEFLAGNAGDRRLARDALRAGLRLSVLQAELGDAAAAMVTAREAERLAEELVAEAPADVELLLQLGSAEGNVSSAAEALGDRAAARTAVERADAVARHALELQPDNVSAWSLLASTLDRAARLAAADGDAAAAERDLREAVALQERAVAARADTGQISYLSQFLNNLAQFLLSTGRLPEARELLERVVEINVQQLARDPDERMAAMAILAARTNLGVLAVTEGRHADAEAELRAAVAQGEELRARFPSDREARKSLASACAVLATTCWTLGRHDEALASVQQAVALQEEMLAETPASPQALGDLALSLNNLGSTLYDLSRPEEAVAPLERGLELMARVSAAVPEDRSRDLLHRSLFQHLAKSRLALGDGAGARAAAEGLAATLPGGDCQRIAAALCSLALPVLAADETLAPEAREAALSDCARRAVELARHAREIGGVTDAALARARDFGPLRERPEFAELSVETAAESP